MKKLILAIATGFGTGYSPVASGTAGSFLAMLIYWFVFPQNPVYTLMIALAVTAVSVYTGSVAEKIFNSRDDSRIVIDEFAGYFVSVLFLPKTLFFAIAAFLLFRLFDVIKPLFINRVQNWRSGWGVTFDDVFAGVFANIILQIVRYAFFR
jgi:phosphatidylglycerophosphatase A